MKNIFKTEVRPLSFRQLKENSGWYLALGIGLVILGTLATFYAWTTTLFSVVYLGFLLIILGIFEGTQSLKISEWSNSFLHLFLGVLYTIAGLYMVWDPGINALSLTLLLSIFFVVSGILKIIFAIINEIPHKFWLALNGILTLILGIIIWQQWPISGLWAIGLLVGIDILFTGWALIMLSLAAKNLTK